MLILGINAYHGDSSACLVEDGKLLCAIEEERIRRIKHWAGFPSESIKWCLSYVKKDIGELDYITVSRDPVARLPKKLLRACLKHPNLKCISGRMSNYSRLAGIKSALAADCGFSKKKIKARIFNIEHHRAHLASSFFVSPFKSAALVSVDGFGDFASAVMGSGSGNNICLFGEVNFPHSLGLFYTAMTQFLGFWNYGDEYKVMGLAAAGQPKYSDAMRAIVKLENKGRFSLNPSYFLHDIHGADMTWLDSTPAIGRLFSDRLVELLGLPRGKNEDLETRFQDIAASTQRVYEETFFHMLNYLHKKTGQTQLALSGGCAQNSLANGRICEKTGFKDVYIPPAAHDAGGAIGSALYLYNQILHNKRVFHMDSPYWGPCFLEEEIKNALDAKSIAYDELPDTRLFQMTAQAISSGKIVGWFQGRTEWGPRALGNRSIITDPRRAEMKDILNKRVKKREWFRPFAPSVLEERTGDWFECTGPVPFMEKVYRIKADKIPLIPAVAHLDGTGRLQTVSRKINTRYHSLIQAFFDITGIPIVLNTSFNENEPIVNNPEDAIDCFLRVGMDVLVLGNFYIQNA